MPATDHCEETEINSVNIYIVIMLMDFFIHMDGSFKSGLSWKGQLLI
jgi:hypothetical protein